MSRTKAIDSALQDLESAELALSQHDVGVARDHLKLAQDTLRYGAVVQGSPPKTGRDQLRERLEKARMKAITFGGGTEALIAIVALVGLAILSAEDERE